MPDIAKQIALLERLTDKQKEVLALVAEGMTSKEIARKIGISESAVNQRIEVIRQRLGGKSRTSIARIYRQAHTLLLTIPTSNSLTGNAIQLQGDAVMGQQLPSEGAGDFDAYVTEVVGALQPSTLPPWLHGKSVAAVRMSIVVGIAVGISAVAVLVLAVGHTLALLAQDLA